VTKDDMLNTVQDIFRDIFDEDDLLVDRSSNSDSIEEWDSLAHINLVTAVEKEFKVKFALGELTSLKDVGDMIDLIATKKT
jgi:acyl carrier protein